MRLEPQEFRVDTLIATLTHALALATMDGIEDGTYTLNPNPARKSSSEDIGIRWVSRGNGWDEQVEGVMISPKGDLGTSSDEF